MNNLTSSIFNAKKYINDERELDLIASLSDIQLLNDELKMLETFITAWEDTNEDKKDKYELGDEILIALNKLNN